MSGFLTAPIMYIANRAAKGVDYLANRAVTSAPVANPRANPAYAAQVFSPDYIDRIAKAQVTGQPVMLPGVEVIASRSNTPAGTVAGTAQSKPSGVAQGKSSQGKPSYDTNTL